MTFCRKIIFTLTMVALASTTAVFAAQPLPSIFKVPFAIGAQFYDYQNYLQVPYFHGGMDLRVKEGTEVLTPIDGLIRVNTYQIVADAQTPRFSYIRQEFKRTDSSNTKYLEVAVKDANGNWWMFRHIEPNSVPEKIFTLQEKNLPVKTGTMIGRVAAWSQAIKPEPEIYSHVHLEILASDSSYLNPADYVLTPPDNISPEIHGIFFLNHETAKGFSGYPTPLVNGKIDLIAMVNDRMNNSNYQHSVYSATWKLDKILPDNSLQEVIPETISYRFNKLPIIGERVQLAKVIYRDSLELLGRTIQANGNSGPRIFLLNLTAGSVKRSYDSYNCLDTRSLPNGIYRCTIRVSDRAGNEKEAIQDFHIKN